MSLKHKPQSTELDHLRNTLADVVGVVGETRQDVKQLDSKIDDVREQLDSKIDDVREHLDSKVDGVREHLSEYDKRFDQLELLIRQLLPNGNN